jgi:diguanylate cyclase (GGDEF)-like protein
MATRKRALLAGMTDYTGVPFTDVLSHLSDWRDATADSKNVLSGLRAEVEKYQDGLDRPQDLLEYVDYFVDLFNRYLGDFERLLTELPRSVSEAHVLIVKQIYDSASFEDQNCVTFKREHIQRSLKDEKLRWLVDDIYAESRNMLIDYKDLSNLLPRLRTFVGTTPKVDRELEQKFRILYSIAQGQRDFDLWVAEASGTSTYSTGVIFIDVVDFKSLNSSFTESVVDRDVLSPLQRFIRGLTIHRGGAYRHGGEEFLVILPNSNLEETAAFAEKLRQQVEAQEFRIGERLWRLTVSVGVAVWPNHGGTFQLVVEAANRAESEAKKSGRNRVQVAENHAETEAKIGEGYAAAQRGELLDPDEVRSRLSELKRNRSGDQPR